LKKVNVVIGYNGLIGNAVSKKNLLKINSKNINIIKNKYFNIVYLAAPGGDKYLINLNPLSDNKNKKIIINVLKTIRCNKIIYFSTTAILENEKKVLEKNEFFKPTITKMCYYSKNRYKIEKFIQKKFKNFQIFRLPALISKNLKKNFFFDVINFKSLKYFHQNTTMQWCDVDNILTYLKKFKQKNKIIHLVSEPIKLINIIRYLDHPIKDFSKNKKRLRSNNITSVYANKMKGSNYHFSKHSIMKKMLNIYRN